MQADTHQCGHPMDQATDPDTVAVVERFTCAYCRAVDRVERAERDRHEKHPEKLDGVFWYARPYDAALDKAKPRSEPAERVEESASGGPRRGRLSRGR